MKYPIKTCVVCHEEFELKPDKPGFANRCPDCTEAEQNDRETKQRLDADERRAQNEMDAERRKTIRDMLYRKDS